MVADSETFGGALSDIRAFCEVVDFGTISSAARRLGQSKGAISRRITRLETVLGVRLLSRGARAVTATDEGLAFHAKAQAGLALLDEAADGARGQREIPRGNLRITAAVDIGVELLPALIVQFRKLYPQITVELLTTDAPIDLAAHRVDLALRMARGDLPDQAMRSVVIVATNIGLYAAPAWLAEHGRPVGLGDLGGLDFVMPDRQHPERSIPLTDTRGRKVEVRSRAVVKATDIATVVRLAEAGAGIGFLPDLVTRRAVAGGSLEPVLPDWQLRGFQLHALTLADRDVPARVRLFRDFIKRELGDVGAPGA